MEQIRDWFRRHLSDPQVVILSLILVVGVVVVTATNRLLAPVFASLVLAYLLEGAVRPLVARGLPRTGAASLVFSGFMVVLVALLLVLGPALWRQTAQLMADLPQILTQGQQVLMGLPERYPDLITEAQVGEVMTRIRGDITGLGQAILERSVASVVGLLTVMVYLVLMPLMVFFFLKDKDRIIEWSKTFLPQERGLVRQVWLDVDLQIGNYVRGKVWEIIIVWGVTALIFSMLDLRFAMLLGFITGISVVIPYIGAAVVTVPVAVVAWFQFGATLDTVWVITAYLVIQFLDGNVLVPLLFSEVVDLHPIAIIVAVLFFGGVWGVWGVFFAIPLATLIKAVLSAWPTSSSLSELPPPTDEDQSTSVA
jgi:putative permease